MNHPKEGSFESQEELILKMKRRKQTSGKATHTGKAGTTRLVMIPSDEYDNKHQKSCQPPNKFSFSHQHLQTILIHQTTELFFVEDIFTLFPEELKSIEEKNHGNC